MRLESPLANRTSHSLVLAFFVAFALVSMSAPGRSGAATQGCGRAGNALRIDGGLVTTGQHQCGIVTFTLGSSSTGILRVLGSGFTGSIVGGVQNASVGAKCVGQGQGPHGQGYNWGCQSSAWFVNGTPTYDVQYLELPVTLSVGTYKLGGEARGYGPFTVELVLN